MKITLINAITPSLYFILGVNKVVKSLFLQRTERVGETWDKSGLLFKFHWDSDEFEHKTNC